MANTNIVSHLAEVVAVQTMQMIPVGNDHKARERKRCRGNLCISRELHPGRELLGETWDVMCQQWLDVTDQWLVSYRRLDAVMT